jgi:hypothetical protein
MEILKLFSVLSAIATTGRINAMQIWSDCPVLTLNFRSLYQYNLLGSHRHFTMGCTVCRLQPDTSHLLDVFNLQVQQ